MDPQYRNVMSKLLGPASTEIIGAIRRTDFDKDCLFGSAASAYQFEGAAKEGGKGLSIWDYMTHHTPEVFVDGSNGDVACDQYHLYEEDVNLMKKTGLEAYRFSISWPRILPEGRINAGINKEGIKFYNNLIDTLLAAGIEPCVTLYHWDLPLSLQLEYGGFLSDQIVQDYVDYAELCFWEFGDRVKNWITFNEGWTFCVNGYGRGGSIFPPKIKGEGNITTTEPQASTFEACGHKGGLRSSVIRTKGDPGRDPYLAGHHMILAHAYTVDLYRKHFQEHQGGKIGITNVSHFFEPLNDTNEDKNACIRALDWMLGWFTAPLATGDYPPNMRLGAGDRLPQFTPEESKLIKGAYDFLGINYYTTWYATNTPKPPGEPDTFLSDQRLTTSTVKNNIPIGDPSGADWLVIVPRGIYNILVYAKETYKINQIYITENGYTEHNDHSLTLSKARVDPVRIKYYNDHLWYLRKAIREGGVNVKAYFLWSFSDNFEWAEGYTSRFGIFFIDFMNGELTRYPKTSAIWWMNFFSKKQLKASSKREAKESEYDLRKKPKTNNL